MASIDTLAAAISDALDRNRVLLADLARSKDLAEHLRDRLARIGFQRRAARANRTAADLEEAQQQAARLSGRLEATLTRIESLRGGNSGTGRPVAALPSPPKPPWSRRPPVPGFSYRKPVADCVEAVRREGWPRNAQGRTSARGNLYTGDGRQVNNEGFRPHRMGEAPPCEDLREPWRSDEHYTTTRHAERDAASLVRKWNLSESVLYLNVPTCGKESGDPHRCDANLVKIFPQAP
jgi:hypothetical protein